MKNINKISIRIYELQDAPFLAEIFFNTMHQIVAKDYSPEEVNAMAPPSSLETESWIKKWKHVPPFVAVMHHKIVGFAEFEETGHIDCFYCHHEYQNCGVGTALMNAIEDKAKQKDINRIFAEVSINAKPFFEAKGFTVVKKQLVHIRGVTLTNFVMEKILNYSRK